MLLVNHWVEMHKQTYDDAYLKKLDGGKGVPEKKMLPITSLNRVREVFNSLDTGHKGCTA